MYRPTMSHHDPVADPEPQAGTFLAFRGEKRFKETFSVTPLRCLPRIRYCHPDTPYGRLIPLPGLVQVNGEYPTL